MWHPVFSETLLSICALHCDHEKTVWSTTGARAAGQYCGLVIHTLGTHLHLKFRHWDSCPRAKASCRHNSQYKSFSADMDCACLRELHRHSYTSDRCASRQEVGYRHEWPPFVELPAFKNWVLCWLGHLQHVAPAQCMLMPHQTALASFILANVDICGHDEAITWQRLCRVPLPADSAVPNEPYPHLRWQPSRHWVPCFLGPWLLLHNSA